MTAGALYQLKLNTNSANNFLEYDPQISFFKIVYRKYTRFSMENIEFDPLSRQTLNFNSNVVMQGNVPRNGDLLKNVYFTFDLPAIYSGKNTSDNSNYYAYYFKWIENIGTNIFNYVSIKISDQEIEKHYSDYINIWKELMLQNEKKNVYNKQIGHTPEVYDPANGYGMNGSYPHITTSTDAATLSTRWDKSNMEASTLENSQHMKMDNIITFSNINDNTIPSISKTKIRVPLAFWFCNDPGLALPLIALQYSTVSFEFEMKPFRDLYTILDINHSNESTSLGKRIKPDDNALNQMSNFTSNYSYNINPKLEGEFIFLDDEERRRFALNDHDYLMTQSRLTDKNGIPLLSTTEETSAKLVPAFNPVSFLTWIVKRDDLTQVNDWNNYSNWVYPEVPPYSTTIANKETKYNLTTSKNTFYTPGNTTHIADYSLNKFKKNVLTNVRIEFDGTDRISKNADYFLNQQIYQHFKTNPKDGIYVYSFSLNPSEYQPSGTCNFSNINYPKIYFSRDTIENFNYYTNKAYIYIVSYNILSISNGIGNMKFTN